MWNRLSLRNNMFYTTLAHVTAGSINLQSTLSASTVNSEVFLPHHPITCTTDLQFHEDGSLECAHVRTGEGDPRTQSCLNSTLAILLFELVHERFS